MISIGKMYISDKFFRAEFGTLKLWIIETLIQNVNRILLFQL